MKKTKQLTFCALMSALGVVILLIGSLLEVFDLCAVLLSATLIFIVCEELGGARAFATYVVCAVISLLLLPSKLVGTEYAIFAIYPILRGIFEKRPRAVCITLKALYMLASATLALVLIRLIFTTGDLDSDIIQIVTWLIGILCLILADIFLKRFSRYYHARLRKLLRIDKFFD